MAEVLEQIAAFFMESRDWNGIPATQISKKYSLRPDWLVGQIGEGLIDIQDARIVLNAHIRRLPIPLKTQIEILDDYDIKNICIYPTEKLLRRCGYGSRIDSAPVFAAELYKGAAQLEFRYFNLPVIDRYMLDPRYVIHWGSTQGSISIKDKYLNDRSLPEDAKCVIESFGLGLDESDERVICSFLRYIAKLGPDQQMYWKSFLHPVPAKAVFPYFQSSVRGEFPNTISVIRAIRREMEIINYIFEKHQSSKLFRCDGKDESQTHYLSSFIKPTKYDFDTFAAALEQLTLARILSETVAPYKAKSEFGNVHGFKGLIRYFVGKHSAQSELEFCLDVVQSIVDARKGVSHNIGENKRGIEYDNLRRELNESVYNAFRIIRSSIEAEFDEKVGDQFLDEWKIHSY